jgi:capsular polysaccharide biosynthesis protein
MIAEIQRLRRRAAVRPIPVLALALLITAGITYKVATKPKLYTADVVLAVNEGSLTRVRDKAIPFDELKEYVASVLLPDAEVEKVIEKHSPGRIDKVGAQFALEQFRERLALQIWKNSFVYYHEIDANAQKSARIGIEVTDQDPDDALEIANDLAAVIIRTHDEQRRKLSEKLAAEVVAVREATLKQLDDISAAIAVKQEALIEARKAVNSGLASRMIVDLAALSQDQKQAETFLDKIAVSSEGAAGRITAAHLDTTISVVDRIRPERHEQSGLVLAMIVAVIGVGSLLGSTLVLGAFDSRVHEVDDVTRLGLPVLGHLPGFPGDHVGSLEARGAVRARVPSFLRWRSQR